MFAASQKCPSGRFGWAAIAARAAAMPPSRYVLRLSCGAWPPSQYLARASFHAASKSCRRFGQPGPPDPGGLLGAAGVLAPGKERIGIQSGRLCA